jgi:hypothetical protein
MQIPVSDNDIPFSDKNNGHIAIISNMIGILGDINKIQNKCSKWFSSLTSVLEKA